MQVHGRLLQYNLGCHFVDLRFCTCRESLLQCDHGDGRLHNVLVDIGTAKQPVDPILPFLLQIFHRTVLCIVQIVYNHVQAISSSLNSP